MLILAIRLLMLLLLGRGSIKGDDPVVSRRLLLSPLMFLMVLILIGIIAVHAEGVVAVLRVLGLQEHVGVG